MKFRKLFFVLLIAGTSTLSLSPIPAQAQVGISINVGTPPPPLPVYDQPDCPGDGYIWTPGYWAWDPNVNDYYWVPGTWVLAPQIGFLWTPAWWGWANGAYCFHSGYWGPHVGFYGGVCYGHGYYGNGYEGGRWNNGHFYYNREANNLRNVHVTNVYNERVNSHNSRVSYNGGRGGLDTRPTASQERANRESHLAATSEQNRHVQAAAANTNLRYSANHGHPDVAATRQAGEFNKNAVPANGQSHHDAATAANNATVNSHPNEVNGVQPKPEVSNFGNNTHHDRTPAEAQARKETLPQEHHATQNSASPAVVHHSEHQAPAVIHQAAAPVHHAAAAPSQHPAAMSHPTGGGHPGSGGGHSAPAPHAGGGGHSGGGGHPSGGGQQHH